MEGDCPILMDDPSTVDQATRYAAVQKQLTEAENMRTYPLWNGVESVVDYAKRIHVPPEISVQLRKGVSIEMVLIPAGKYMMGVEEPVRPSGSRFFIIESQTLIGLGASLFISMLIIPLGRAFRLSQRPSFSLRWLMVFTLGLSLISVGTARLYQGDPWEKYRQDLAHYETSPARFECVGHPFYMGKCKLTQYQAGPGNYTFTGFENPAESMAYSWARDLCERINLNQTAELACVRLPTEPEWEFACRAGTRFDYVTGNLESDLDRVAWYSKNSDETTHPVGLKVPNEFGLYDMLGNLPEWCDSETGPILRGSSFQSMPHESRSTSRIPVSSYGPYELVGIRLVMPCWAAKYLEP